jgi:septal ring factor EnvC (AmiA/AmiB activator)
MRRSAPLLLLPLLAAASAPVQPAEVPLDRQLQQARSEQAAAEAEATKLEQAAGKARGDLERLRAEQIASAQALEAAEARITAADMQVRLASAYVVAHRRQLAEQQRPVSSLLAGLAVMGRRPPLLAMSDQGGPDELVKVRILLDTTLPVIRARTAKLSTQLSEGRRLEQAAAQARAEQVGSRRNLLQRRAEFASVERKAMELAAKSGSRALNAGDIAIAANEDVENLQGGEGRARAAASIAAQLASEDPAPARTIGPEGGVPRPPFDYGLPVAALVTEGLASIDDSGVRARGLTFGSYRGAAVSAPAAGTVRFSGPFRDYDGVLIIDHGDGWLSLIVNVGSTLHPGDRIRLGEDICRALGPLQVELSQYGRRISPAIIAGSSENLSKNPKGS